MASFKMPLPCVVKKVPVSVPYEANHIGLPNFEKKEFENLSLIGKGSYGKVFKGTRGGNEFVIKELESGDISPNEQRLFIKEAKLLKSLAGHENILEIHGFSMRDNAMLLDYIRFDFTQLGINHEPVFNLKELLLSCDKLNDFNDFCHVPYHLAMDIVTGLDYLHSKGIVHRDLKPENILVSNTHYVSCEKHDLGYWWTTRPVVAKLTDFGESRSALVQTRSISQTSTQNIFRGSPVYMAPEAIQRDDKIRAAIRELQQMDIWSLGMVLFHLINPNAKHPFARELEEENHPSPMKAICDLMKKQTPPLNQVKYNVKRQTSWRGLEQVYRCCIKFKAEERPTSKQLKRFLVRQHVHIDPLLTSQSSVTEAVDAEYASGHFDSFHSNAGQTLNACSFLALLAAVRVLKKDEDRQLSEITQDLLLNFQEEVNCIREEGKSYSIDEAFTMLLSCGAVKPHDLEVLIPSKCFVSIPLAIEELCRNLTKLLEESGDEPFSAVYTSPPYSYLICKLKEGKLSIVDTHPIPKLYGGTGTAGVVTADNSDITVKSLCNWLVQRTAYGKEQIVHELTVIKSSQASDQRTSPPSSIVINENSYTCLSGDQCTSSPSSRVINENTYTCLSASRQSTSENIASCSNKVSLLLYSDSDDNLDKATAAINKYQKTKTTKKTLRDSLIGQLFKEDLLAIEDIGNEYPIKVEINTQKNEVLLVGANEDLLEVTGEVNKIIRSCQEDRHLEHEAKILAENIQWHFKERTTKGMKLIPYSKRVNLKLEKAFKNNKKVVEFITTVGKVHKVDFIKMQEYPKHDYSDKVDVIRRENVAGSGFDVPDTWDDMGDEQLKEVTLKSSSSEYKQVEKTFKDSVFQGKFQTTYSQTSFSVSKIIRIQNKYLYQQFEAKKKQLENQNPAGTKHEQTLWHGTKSGAISSINYHGFNHSYCATSNDAWFGNCVYFANDAGYSCADWSSRPDASGMKYLYMARVLTGRYCQGVKGMRVLPVRTGNILYDSAVETLSNPTEFIIFNDTQAYPQYMIHFKK